MYEDWNKQAELSWAKPSLFWAELSLKLVFVLAWQRLTSVGPDLPSHDSPEHTLKGVPPESWQPDAWNVVQTLNWTLTTVWSTNW